MKYSTIIMIVLLYFSTELQANDFYFDISNEIIFEEYVSIDWKSDIEMIDLSFILDGEVIHHAENLLSSSGKYLWYPDIEKINNKEITIKADDKSGELEQIIKVKLLHKAKIIHQTDEIRRCFGQDAELSVKYIGEELSFQWFIDGNKIIGATKPWLYIPFLHYENSGNYVCEIYQNEEIIKSKPIPVYAVSETEIIHEPEIMAFIEGKDYSFKVKAHANGIGDDYKFDFQWYADGVELEDNSKYSGVNSNILNISSADLDDMKPRYHCLVVGLCGAAETTPKRLIQGQIFGYIDESKEIRFCSDADEVIIDVKIESPFYEEMEFSWRRAYIGKIDDNEIYEGTKTSKLTIKNMNLSEFTFFYLEISIPEMNYKNEFGSYALQKVFPPEFALDLPDKWVAFDHDNGEYYGKVRLYVEPKGTFKEQKKIKYQWYRDGELFYEGAQMPFSSGQNVWGGNPNLDTWWFNYFMIGKWQCKMFNECHETWSNICEVKLGYPDLFLCEDDETELTVDSVELQENEIYIWHHEKKYLNKINITYEDNTLFISNPQPEDEGTYYCYTYNQITKKITSTVAKVYLKLNNKPIVLKNLPEEIHPNANGYFDQQNFIFKYYNTDIYYEIYRDGIMVKSEDLNKSITQKFAYLTELISIDHFTSSSAEYYIRIYDNVCMNYYTNICKFIGKEGIVMSQDDSETREKLKIYPNPIRDYFRFEISQQIESAVLIDKTGRIIQNFYNVNINNQIDMTKYPNGDYYFITSGKEGTNKAKIIKLQ